MKPWRKSRDLYIIPEDAKIINVKSKEIPRLFLPHHCIDPEAELWIKATIKYRHDYLRQPELEQTSKLTHSNFKGPLLIEALEKTVREFRMVCSDGEMIGTAPWPENIIWTMRLLMKIWRNCYYEVLANGLAILEPPIWGKTNNPQQWWSLNDYEILSAAFWHKGDLFRKFYSPYLSKGESKPKPVTPWKSVNLLPTILGLLPPKKSRNMTFLEALPISSITSSTRLGTIVGTALAVLKESSKDFYPP